MDGYVEIGSLGDVGVYLLVLVRFDNDIFLIHAESLNKRNVYTIETLKSDRKFLEIELNIDLLHFS